MGPAIALLLVHPAVFQSSELPSDEMNDPQPPPSSWINSSRHWEPVILHLSPHQKIKRDWSCPARSQIDLPWILSTDFTYVPWQDAYVLPLNVAVRTLDIPLGAVVGVSVANFVSASVGTFVDTFVGAFVNNVCAIFDGATLLHPTLTSKVPPVSSGPSMTMSYVLSFSALKEIVENSSPNSQPWSLSFPIIHTVFSVCSPLCNTRIRVSK